MIFISHRGDINSINIKDENNHLYIFNALNKNFDVEVDIWFQNNKFYLGHDKPKYRIDLSFIKKGRLWFHA